MTSLFTSYFLPLVLAANIFNFQTSLCDISVDEALIAVAAKAAAKDKETQDLYAICDVGYGLMITILQDAAQSLANKNYIVLENDLSKCSRFVSDCQNALGSKTTPEITDEALIAGICRQVQNPPFSHPYVAEEVTRAAIAQSLQNANNNHAFLVAAKAAAKDKETQDLYAICDVGYGLMITILQDAAQSLANKNYIVLENDLSKCPIFVSDCQNALGSKMTPEMLDRSRKQFDLLIMSEAAEGLIKK
ncbi:hypothetical protein H5410_022558 [Solanum commersonii]|uniref:Pectinesterase inhibitor domain-containing protein n=1 Tax=Solanum commersonii TaxID=4109 RepID=A0A9J5ZFS6_SOLCO|nr:hypothetical protein H5410_022558 [Solanum commersonii]